MKKQILIIDDDKAFIDSMLRMLRNKLDCWEIHTANHANDAIQIVQDHSIDVIVTDINMPEMDGLELLNYLKKNNDTTDIPVILMTGRNVYSDIQLNAVDKGAIDFLEKPIKIELLTARLNNSIKLKEARDLLKQQNDHLEEKIRERTIALEKSQLDIILRLGKAAEYRDEETGHHTLRVGCYCRVIAETLNMSPDFIDMLFLASPLHDIGKIGIEDRILLKPGVLTDDEYEIMKQHCRIGADILLSEPTGILPYLDWNKKTSSQLDFINPLMELAATITLTHHEKWDGSGYPEGLKGTDIPISGRITALADVYDALRSKRPYKEAFTEERTYNIIKAQAGAHFDPMVIDAFEKERDTFDRIFTQFTSDEQNQYVPNKKVSFFS